MTSKQTVFELHAGLLASLAHPTRLEIIQLLRGQSLTVSQIVQMTGVRQATVSQHLMILREAGVLESNKSGKESYYHIRHSNFSKAIDLMRDVLNIDLPEGGEPTVVDPICHMELTPRTASHHCMYGGVRQYFCGKGCMNTFMSSHKGDT
jgi:DNA-binding transcriptional ArsR family regulator/YHS domain-containing protein